MKPLKKLQKAIKKLAGKKLPFAKRTLDEKEFVTNGAFTLDIWKHCDFIVAKKNDLYWDAKEVKLLNTIDSSLIGGFLIKADSKMVDLSIKGQLNQFAKHLDNVLKI